MKPCGRNPRRLNFKEFKNEHYKEVHYRSNETIYSFLFATNEEREEDYNSLDYNLTKLGKLYFKVVAPFLAQIT